MKHAKCCRECGGTDIRTTTVSSGGGYSPDLLPGTHPWWKSGKLEVFIGSNCGQFQLFVPTDVLESVVASSAFRRL